MTNAVQAAVTTLVDELLAIQARNEALLRQAAQTAPGVLVNLEGVFPALEEQCFEVAQLLAKEGIVAPALAEFLNHPSLRLVDGVVSELRLACA